VLTAAPATLLADKISHGVEFTAQAAAGLTRDSLEDQLPDLHPSSPDWRNSCALRITAPASAPARHLARSPGRPPARSTARPALNQ